MHSYTICRYVDVTLPIYTSMCFSKCVTTEFFLSLWDDDLARTLDALVFNGWKHSQSVEVEGVTSGVVLQWSGVIRASDPAAPLRSYAFVLFEFCVKNPQ